MNGSIYERIGGEAAIMAAVDLFCENVLADDVTRPFFEGGVRCTRGVQRARFDGRPLRAREARIDGRPLRPWPFDRVVLSADGRQDVLSASAFLELPLHRRIGHILRRDVEFFSGKQPIERRAALQSVRRFNETSDA